MTRSLLLLAAMTCLASLVGCDRAASPEAGSPAMVTVRRADPDTPSPRSLTSDEDVGPIGFPFEGARGYVRATMEITGTSESPGPFLHDALFLAHGAGRLSLSIRKPWPGHERGRVTIRCEGDDAITYVDYEPELWFGHPDAKVAVEALEGPDSAQVKEGDDLLLARIVASGMPGRPEIILTFKAAFAAEPIKPRVKAGVRPPR